MGVVTFLLSSIAQSACLSMDDSTRGPAGGATCNPVIDVPGPGPWYGCIPSKGRSPIPCLLPIRAIAFGTCSSASKASERCAIIRRQLFRVTGVDANGLGPTSTSIADRSATMTESEVCASHARSRKGFRVVSGNSAEELDLGLDTGQKAGENLERSYSSSIIVSRLPVP
jgi:hypothetical protein